MLDLYLIKKFLKSRKGEHCKFIISYFCDSVENPFEEKINVVQGSTQNPKSKSYGLEFDPFSDDNKI